jgi:hypothetical protein
VVQAPLDQVSEGTLVGYGEDSEHNTEGKVPGKGTGKKKAEDCKNKDSANVQWIFVG